MEYQDVAIKDTDVPVASSRVFQHLLKTYASEVNKLNSVWNEFAAVDLSFKPHPRSTTVQEVMTHELLSQRRFFGEFLGLPEVAANEVLPEDHTPHTFAARMVELSRKRLDFLAKQDEDPAKEMAFNGVYRFANGRVQALVRDLNRPNGLAFSPDFKVLYVNNSDAAKNLVMRYDVAADGTLANGRVLADLTSKTDGLTDGLKVDAKGNLYTSGPGGIWVLSSEGKHLGTIEPPEVPANCGWGDDGKTLYLTAVTSVYRVKTLVGR